MWLPELQVGKIPPYTHGGINHAELSRLMLNADDVLDFSTCCNPYGPPPQVHGALRNARIECYPDPDSTDLIQSLSSKLDIDPQNIIAGSGSTELIRLVTTAFLGSRNNVVIPAPTYGEYELACRIVKARVLHYGLRESENFQLKTGHFISYVKRCRPAGIFLCNPNNPTGQYLDFYDVKRIVTACHETLVLLDEAYVAFTDDAWSSLDLLNEPNLFILRSMTKDFALAGLRLGYGIASKEIIRALKRIRPPWNVSSIAQQAGIAALGCDSYLAGCCARIARCKRYLTAHLSESGFEVVPSQTNFFIFRVGDAAAFRSRLLKKGMLVRDCSSFGLPEYIRIAPRRMSDCRRLINAIMEMEWQPQ